MPSYKNDPSGLTYDAGDDFNYAVWTADTEISLCNVPWPANYKDVAHFDSTGDLNAYIDARAEIVNITNASYARVDEPISIDIPFARANQYNYIRAFNPAQPVPGDDIPKYYYYFIVGMVHDAPNTTRIIVQLDVWQTWIREIEFGMSYVERGHIGIANENNFNNNGRDYLTIPDGLDTGTDYVNVVTKYRNLLPNTATVGCSVVVFSTVDLQADPGTNDDPNNPSARPSRFGGVPTGAAGFVFLTASAFMRFMAKYSQYPWMTSGIISISLVPDLTQLGYDFTSADVDPKTGSVLLAGNVARHLKMYPGWRDDPDYVNYIPERYRGLSKLKTSPYTMIEITANGGSALVCKPELWNSPDMQMFETSSFLPPNQRIVYYPAGYNGRNPAMDFADGTVDAANDYRMMDGDYLDMSLIVSSFPSVPIVNNGQIDYLARNAHGIAAQYQSLDWSQSKSLRGNQLGAENATVGMNAGMAQTANALAGDMSQLAIQQELQSQTALAGLVSGGAMGIAGGAAGGPAGMAAGGTMATAGGAANLLTLGMQQDAATRAYGARSATAWQGSKISYGAAGQVRDNNLAYGNYATRGDYANERNMLDGKIRDTQMIPQGVSGGFGGDGYLFTTNQMRLIVKLKMVDQASIARVGEFWLRYGYPVGRPTRIPNDLRVMDKFSYWKLSECYIVNAAMPETFKQTVRGVLESGVTVWQDADEIGVIDFADNRPLPDIVIGGFTPPPWTPEEPPAPPTPTRRKQKKMLVYQTDDGGPIYALAGSAGAGVVANFLTTRDAVLMGNWLEACGVADTVPLDMTTFYDYQAAYTAQVNVLATAVTPFNVLTTPA